MKSPRHHSGFSLIEVMVAVLILAIALTGLVHGITTALASSKESELQTVAALFAQGKIEELRATGILEDGSEDGDCGAMLTLYRWRETVSSTDISGLHNVSVVVEHTKSGREIFELKTMLFSPDDDSTAGKSGKHKDSKSKKRRGSSS
jgi:general secretion pathway protein I